MRVLPGKKSAEVTRHPEVSLHIAYWADGGSVGTRSCKDVQWPRIEKANGVYPTPDEEGSETGLGDRHGVQGRGGGLERPFM